MGAGRQRLQQLAADVRQTSLTQLWGAFRLLVGTALVATAFVLRLDHSPTLAQQICSSPRVSRGGRRTALGAAQTASCNSSRTAAESRPSFANYSMRQPPSLPRRRPRGKLRKTHTHSKSKCPITIPQSPSLLSPLLSLSSPRSPPLFSPLL